MNHWVLLGVLLELKLHSGLGPKPIESGLLLCLLNILFSNKQ